MLYSTDRILTTFAGSLIRPPEVLALTPEVEAGAGRWGGYVSGIEMFVRQAALQYEYFTGAAAPIELYLPGGERLCIANDVNAATLRGVLDALRS